MQKNNSQLSILNFQLFYEDATYAKEVLNWEATKTIDEMCEDSWRWQMNNLDGYKVGEIK